MKHIIVSAILFMVFTFIFKSITIAFGITLSIGLLKEIYDLIFGETGFSIVDIGADVIGIMIGFLILLVIGILI